MNILRRLWQSEFRLSMAGFAFASVIGLSIGNMWFSGLTAGLFVMAFMAFAGEQWPHYFKQYTEAK